MSERLRLERREDWQKSTKLPLLSKSKSFLLIIDENTAKLSHWKDLSPEKLGSFGVYHVWRVKRKELESREMMLKQQGIIPNWREPKNEKF